MAKQEKWNGSPVKPGNWGTWAQIEYAKGTKQSCYTCTHCHDDLSCSKTGAVIAEIGKSFFRQCSFYQLSDFYSDLDKESERRKPHHNAKTDQRKVNSTVHSGNSARKRADSYETYSAKKTPPKTNPQITISEKQRRKKDVWVGKRVFHKIYGSGIIVKTSGNKITVDFYERKSVIFSSPMCFEKGFLKTE